MSSRAWHASVVAGVSALCGACAELREGTPHPVHVDSLGVKIVSHGELSEYERPTYRPEFVLRIPETRQGAQPLGEVGWVGLLEDGRLGVLDAHAAVVRVFDMSGSENVRFGRFGSGPGELTGDGTVGVFAGADGSAIVPDLGNQAVMVFGREGDLRASHRLDITEAFLAEWQEIGGGRFVVRQPRREEELFLLREVDGALTDTLAKLPATPPDPAPDLRSPIWLDFAVWSAGGPTEVALGRMSEPSIRLYCEGELSRIVRWERTGTMLSPKDVDVLLTIVATTLGVTDGSVPSDLRARMRPPIRRHVLADVQIGPAGLVLVQRLRPLDEMDRRVLSTFKASGFGGPLWDVFSSTGEYLGALDFGANVDVFEIQGDTIVGVLEDPMGIGEPFLAVLPPEMGGRSTPSACQA